MEQSKFTAIVTGYAFEDTGGDIYTGQTPEPSALAMGATGIAALRRRRNVQAIDVSATREAGQTPKTPD